MSATGIESAAVKCELAGEVVRTFGQVRLRVLGTSMVPAIHPGDLVSIQSASLSELLPGEIILYSRKGRMFAHRLVRHEVSTGQAHLILRGDRLGQNDPPVLPSELLGRVQFIERGERRLVPASRPNLWKRVITRFLRTSDRATYLYLRLEARRQKLFPRRAECRV